MLIKNLSWNYEQKYWSQRLDVVGIDEVGRGALAGPLIAAAVIIPQKQSFLLEGINDSKKISAKKRDYLSEKIRTHCQWSIGEVSVEEINEKGITYANNTAMLRAANNLRKQVNICYSIDGTSIPSGLDPAECIVDGDALIPSIAAASIIAKVYRDALMTKLHETEPRYAFDQHKGYGTALHLDRLRTHGASIHHRINFEPVKKVTGNW